MIFLMFPLSLKANDRLFHSFFTVRVKNTDQFDWNHLKVWGFCFFGIPFFYIITTLTGWVMFLGHMINGMPTTVDCCYWFMLAIVVLLKAGAKQHL